MSDKNVELSTVFFYPKGSNPPSHIELSKCGPPMLTQNEESITCLYGLRHRRLGFKQIHDYAEKHGLDYEVVDMKLPVREAPTTVNQDDLGKQDVLSLARISGDVKEKLYEGMGISADLSRSEQQAKLIDKLSSHPDAINDLRQTLNSDDVPLVIHPTRLRGSEESIAVANLAKSSCADLKDIRCRTKNSVEVTNDLGDAPSHPKENNKHNDADSKKEVQKSRPKS